MAGQKWPWLRLPGLTGVLGGQEALKKTLHGDPAGSVFLDFDQKRAFSRPERFVSVHPD